MAVNCWWAFIHMLTIASQDVDTLIFVALDDKILTDQIMFCIKLHLYVVIATISHKFAYRTPVPVHG